MLSLYKTIENIKKLAFQGIYKKPYNLSKKAQLANEPVKTPAPTATPTTPPDTVPVKYEPKYADYIESYIYNNRENLREGLPLSPLPPQILQEILNNPEERNVYKKLVNSILGPSAAQSFNNQLFGGELDSADSRFVTNPVNNLQSQQPQRVSEPDYSSDNSVYSEAAKKLIATGKLNYLINEIKNSFELYGSDKLGDDYGRANSYLNERVNYGFGAPQTPLSNDQRLEFFLLNDDLLPPEIKDFIVENSGLKNNQLNQIVMRKYGKQLIERLKLLINQAAQIDSTDKKARESDPIYNWINKSVRSGLKGSKSEKSKNVPSSIDSAIGEEGTSIGDMLSTNIQNNLTKFRQDDPEIEAINKRMFQKFSNKITGFFVKKCISNLMKNINNIKDTVTKELYKYDKNKAERLDFYVSSTLDSAEKLLKGDESLNPKILHLPNGTISYRNDLGYLDIPEKDVEQASIYIKNKGIEDAKINAESDEAELARMRGEQTDFDAEAMYTDANIEKYTNEYVNKMKNKPEWVLNWATLFSKSSVTKSFQNIGNLKKEIIKYKSQNITDPIVIMNNLDKNIINNNGEVEIQGLDNVFDGDQDKKIRFIKNTLEQSDEELKPWFYAGKDDLDPNYVPKDSNKKKKTQRLGTKQLKEQFTTDVKSYLSILYPLSNSFSDDAKQAFMAMMSPHIRILTGKDAAVDKKNNMTYTEMYHNFVGNNKNEDPIQNKKNELLKKITELKTQKNRTKDIIKKTNDYEAILAEAHKNQRNQELHKDITNAISTIEKEIDIQNRFYFNFFNEIKENRNRINNIRTKAMQQNRKRTLKENLAIKKLRDKNKVLSENVKKRKNNINELIKSKKVKNQAKTYDGLNALKDRLHKIEQDLLKYKLSPNNIDKISIANSSVLRILQSMLEKTRSKIALLSNMQIKMAKIDPENNVIHSMMISELFDFHNTFFRMIG